MKRQWNAEEMKEAARDAYCSAHFMKWTQKVGHNWKVQMKKEFSLEEKMSAIGFVFQGESARSVFYKN